MRMLIGHLCNRWNAQSAHDVATLQPFQSLTKKGDEKKENYSPFKIRLQGFLVAIGNVVSICAFLRMPTKIVKSYLERTVQDLSLSRSSQDRLVSLETLIECLIANKNFTVR